MPPQVACCLTGTTLLILTAVSATHSPTNRQTYGNSASTSLRNKTMHRGVSYREAIFANSRSANIEAWSRSTKQVPAKTSKGWGSGNYPGFQKFQIDYLRFRYGLTREP